MPCLRPIGQQHPHPPLRATYDYLLALSSVSKPHLSRINTEEYKDVSLIYRITFFPGLYSLFQPSTFIIIMGLLLHHYSILFHTLAEESPQVKKVSSTVGYRQGMKSVRKKDCVFQYLWPSMYTDTTTTTTTPRLTFFVRSPSEGPQNKRKLLSLLPRVICNSLLLTPLCLHGNE